MMRRTGKGGYVRARVTREKWGGDGERRSGRKWEQIEEEVVVEKNGDGCTYGGGGDGMMKKEEEDERRDATQRRGMLRSRSCARTRNGEPGSMCGEKTAVIARAAPVMTALSARNAGNAYTRHAFISARVVPAATNGDDGRPKLTKESEPQEYWKSKAEREGKTPWQDPLVISLLVSFVLIFVILGVAIGTGYVG